MALLRAVKLHHNKGCAAAVRPFNSRALLFNR